MGFARLYGPSNQALRSLKECSTYSQTPTMTHRDATSAVAMAVMIGMIVCGKTENARQIRPHAKAREEVDRSKRGAPRTHLDAHFDFSVWKAETIQREAS